jgi:hypothetical protein
VLPVVSSSLFLLVFTEYLPIILQLLPFSEVSPLLTMIYKLVNTSI